MFVIQEQEIDLGSVFRQRSERSRFVTGKKCIPAKTTLDWSAVVSYGGDLILLFSVVFCLVRDARIFDLRLVMNWTPKSGDQWKVKQTRFWQGIYYVSSVNFARTYGKSRHTGKVNPLLLSSQCCCSKSKLIRSFFTHLLRYTCILTLQIFTEWKQCTFVAKDMRITELINWLTVIYWLISRISYLLLQIPLYVYILTIITRNENCI
jgi:hypothetical protein